MPYATRKPEKVEYIVWTGTNKTAITEFFSHDISRFAFKDTLTPGPSTLIVTQPFADVEVETGDIIYRDGELAFITPADKFDKMFDR